MTILMIMRMRIISAGCHDNVTNDYSLSEIIISDNGEVIVVIMNVIISASDYEGNENERAVKMMTIQRMTPS